MMRKLFAAVLVALGPGLGLALGTAGTAGAASTSVEERSFAVWYTYDYYLLETECDRMGKTLVATGQVIAWTCIPAQAPHWPWALRVLD
ncbi:hypothetical protein [Nonomuraea sp. NPDC050783]|uniref:hypothetical protein n=1 Tax=Nonomuraea sp. NPDC050783 TaxID=3154634 RepID=UPI0034656E99